MLKKTLIALAAASCLSLSGGLASAQAPDPDVLAKAEKEGSVMFYNSATEEALTKLKNGFEKKYPKIKLNFWRAPASEMITRVQAEQSSGRIDQAALVRVGQLCPDVGQWHPGHLGDLDVGVGQLTAGGAQQVVAHGLVDAAALGDEPEVDGAEFGQDLAADAGLFLDLADGGLLGCLAGFDVTLGQRPEQPTVPVGAADEGAPGYVALEVDDQPAGAVFVYPPQPLTAATSGPGAPRAAPRGSIR